MKPSELHAIFFDFDGVILDSTRIKTDTFKALYKPYGNDIVDKVVKHHLQHGGISRVEKIKYCHEEFLKIPLTEDQLNFLTGKFSMMVKDQVVEADWIDGAEEFIKNYYQSVDHFIISGTPQHELLEIVTRRNIRKYFKEILGSPTKKPVHVSRIMDQENCDPARCIFVGDAITDLNTAIETGTQFIGIQGEVAFPGGTIVLPNCQELESEIRKMN